MTIACIGWGSLIWKPENLQIISEWSNDGPLLPIEFARESNGNRITLVLTDQSHTVPSLWCLLAAEDLEQAKAELADRENVPQNFIGTSIGYWERRTGNSHGQSREIIKNWAWPRDIDAVVWTNLKYGFRDSRDELPTSGEIVAYLQSIPDENSKEALNYIKNTPPQIDTPYRRIIKDCLNI